MYSKSYLSKSTVLAAKCTLSIKSKSTHYVKGSCKCNIAKYYIIGLLLQMHSWVSVILML